MIRPALRGIAVGLALGTAALQGSAQEAPSLGHRYDMEHPRARFDLPGRLEEVSGLTFGPGGALFAHDDERGDVFRIDPSTGSVDRGFELGDGRIRADFEAIAAVGERLFLITSTGTLYEFRAAPEHGSAPVRVTDVGLGGGCEVEGMTYAAARGELLMACKSLRPEAREIRIHRIPVSDGGAPLPPIRVPFASLEAVGFPHGLHPSGIDIDPATGRIVLVAARDEAIVEIGPDGTVVWGMRFGRSRHRQPEGIAFGPDGLLYVADEANGRRARLTVYGPPDGSGSR